MALQKNRDCGDAEKNTPMTSKPSEGVGGAADLRSSSDAASDAAMYTVLTTEMHDMARGLSIIAERRRPVQQAVIHILTGVVSSLWPGARVEPYGSFATGLTSPSSDVDLLVRGVYGGGTGGATSSTGGGIADGAAGGAGDPDGSHAGGAHFASNDSAATGNSAYSLGGSNAHVFTAQVGNMQATNTSAGSNKPSYRDNNSSNYSSSINNKTLPRGGDVADAYPFSPFSREIETMIYSQFYQVLQKQTWVESCKLIPHAKVPIIKVQTGAVPMDHGTLRTGYKPLLSIDIAIERPLIQGVPRQKFRDTTEVVCRLVDRYPAIRPLALIIKQLLVERGLNEPFNGGLTTYGLVLMITHVLRRHERQNATEVDRYNPNLGRLLLGFFRYYGNEFDPLKCGITLLNETGEFDRAQALCSGAIVVQDPVDMSNNVAGGCFGYPMLRQTFADAARVIQKAYLEIRDVAAISGRNASGGGSSENVGDSSGANVASAASSSTGGNSKRTSLAASSKLKRNVVSMLGRMFSTRHHINVVKHASKMWCPRELRHKGGGGSGVTVEVNVGARGKGGSGASGGSVGGQYSGGGGSRSGRKKKKGSIGIRKLSGGSAISSMLAGDGGAGERGGVEVRLRQMEAMLAQVLRQNSNLVLENDGLRVRMASIEEQMAKAIGREGIGKM